jgi:hypothetical protein
MARQRKPPADQASLSLFTSHYEEDFLFRTLGDLIRNDDGGQRCRLESRLRENGVLGDPAHRPHGRRANEGELRHLRCALDAVA